MELALLLLAANTLDLQGASLADNARMLATRVQPADNSQQIITVGSHHLHLASIHLDTHLAGT
jgi:hypothetical protein